MDDLDRWRNVRVLGAGAFGQVHLAWDTVDRRYVALKRFTGQDELGLLRFVIESRIRVAHPHLVRTLAFRLVDDQAVLVTELARGGSVRQLMDRSGRLPLGWVVEAVDHVLDALVALHATGVVHRDLKPANLLLRDAGPARPHLLVGDFGIATWRTVSMTGIGAAIGTPGYLAPEYLDGTPPSPTTDLFAVGVLAAELLAGRRLVHYSNSSPDIPADWTGLLPLPDDVPPAIAAVLRRMADPDVRRRYADCAEAREALLAASPPGSRGELAVPLPDLLAGLPAGWTPDGPVSTDPAPDRPDPDDTGPDRPAPTDPAPDRPELGGTERDRPEADDPAPADSPVGPAGDSAPAGAPTQADPVQPADATVAVAPDPVTVTPLPQAPPADRRPATVPWHTETSTSDRRPRRKRRRLPVLILVLLLLLGGGAATWWVVANRTVEGTATSGGGTVDDDGDPDTPPTEWRPVQVERCSRVDLGQERVRDGDRQRCQRTQSQDAPQHWVREPADGFPTSDPTGPFPGEECARESDTAYSPVGARLRCQDGSWQPRA